MELQQVILVNEQDEPIGAMEKMEAHKRGFLHRAFSIFIFNSKGELLLQQRALDKYHSGGLWSNSCCSHPQPGEETLIAAQRRLKEEMGFTTGLEKIFDFIYKADFHSGIIEFELDHVLTGEYDGRIECNKEEVMDYSYKNMDAVRGLLKADPRKFTIWFRVAFPKIEEWWSKHYKNAIA